MEAIYDPILGKMRTADTVRVSVPGEQGVPGERGERGEQGESAGHNLVVCRTFFDDNYGQVAWLDDLNNMELIGYHAEPVSRLELYLVSANAQCTGNIVLIVGEESFVVPVGEFPAKVTLTPATPLTGTISIVRDTGNAADTLNDGTDPITVFVVDGRWY